MKLRPHRLRINWSAGLRHGKFSDPAPGNLPDRCQLFRTPSLSLFSRFKSLALALALALPLSLVAADQPAPTNAPATTVADTNSPADAESLRNYLHLQEQLHTAQLAIERNRREAADAATRNAEVIAERLQALEQSLTAQRAAEKQQLEGTYRLMLMVGGGCVALGFLAMLLTAYFQWRAVGRLTEFSMVSQASLAAGRAGLNAPGAVAELTNSRFNDALARIEGRIRELEHAAHTPSPGSTITVGDTISASTSALPEPRPQRIAVLVAKGQSLLDLDKPEEALGVFNDILTIDPGHTETLVKKGDTLERLRRLDEAIECYDAAIAADANFTVAYLHKGGLFNRMDRHEEALKCYEEALRTQEKNQVA
jgi:tetratricopeptide (TPR) repeat protein